MNKWLKKWLKQRFSAVTFLKILTSLWGTNSNFLSHLIGLAEILTPVVLPDKPVVYPGWGQAEGLRAPCGYIVSQQREGSSQKTHLEEAHPLQGNPVFPCGSPTPSDWALREEHIIKAQWVNYLCIMTFRCQEMLKFLLAPPKKSPWLADASRANTGRVTSLQSTKCLLSFLPQIPRKEILFWSET